MRTALGRLLRLADYEVRAFASGDEFLASLATSQPACVLLDVHMPGLTGFDVFARMRGAHRYPGDFHHGERCTRSRADGDAEGARLLRKPFSNDVLLAAVSALEERAQPTVNQKGECHEQVETDLALTAGLMSFHANASAEALASWNDGPAKRPFSGRKGDCGKIEPEVRSARRTHRNVRPGRHVVGEHPVYGQMMYCLDRVPPRAKPELKDVEPFRP